MVDVAATLVRGEVRFFDEEFVPGFAAIRVDDGTEEESTRVVEGLPGLLYATRSAIAELASQPNDPWFSQQWQFQNTGQIVNSHTGASGLANCDVCAIPAWAIRPEANPVIVAVLDSGFNYLQPDLLPNMWVNPLDPAGNGDDDNNGYKDDIYGIRINGCDANYDPADPYESGYFAGQHFASFGGFHGTAVASFVGTRGNNSIGGTGMAWKVRIMALAAYDYDVNGAACGYLDEVSIIIGFKYAWLHGAQVMNCSFGFGAPHPALYDAFSYLHEQGMIAVVAAHNYTVDIDNAATPPTTGLYPARYTFDNMIVVGASDPCNRRSIWSATTGSNWGVASVDLFAPGTDLRTFDGNDYCGISSLPPNYCSGTSFATPLVSGAAALVLAQNPTWSAKKVVDQLVGTAKSVTCLQGLCVSGGILDVAKALGGQCDHGAPCCPMPTGPCCSP